jgi:hypothetical protein
MQRKRSAVLMSLSILALTACANPSEPAPEMRVLVQLAQPLDDAARIADQAARSSGKPVRYLAASGGGWHALALGCAGTDDCEAALQRLRADRSSFLAAQRDERKRIVTP